MNEEQEESSSPKMPPYIAFQSLKTLLDKLKKDGLPGQIDRSVLTNFSGAVGGQVITALKFLGLTTPDNRPTQLFKSLIDAYGSDTWPTTLMHVIKRSYPRVFEISLENASPQQFSSHFKSVYPGQDTVLQKCMGFFLNAARDAQIPISNYILKKQKVRSGPTKKRSPSAPKAAKRTGNGGASESHNDFTPPPVSQKPSEVLLSLFSADMRQAEQDAIWTLIKHFKAKGDKAA